MADLVGGPITSAASPCVRNCRLDENGICPGCFRTLEEITGRQAANADELTLSLDPDSGECTRLTHFRPGADTTPFGAKSHEYPEEIFIVSGRLNDQAFDLWLTAGHYTSRPPGERTGRSARTSAAWSWRCRFPIGRATVKTRRWYRRAQRALRIHSRAH